MAKNKRVDLLVIDMQCDFCSPQGNLFVTGADQDAKRLGAFIDRLGKKIDQIHFTLDSHNEVDIAHPIFWVNSKGEHPGVFTIISNKDVVNGTWRPTIQAYKDWALFYTAELEKKGRYPLCIWPPHCRICHTEKRPVLDSNGKEVKISTRSQDGTSFETTAQYDFCGHAVHEPVSSALSRWCLSRIKTVNFVVKGSNVLTEHYSAVKAEVPDPKDVTTQINTRFIQTIEHADEIYVAGEALSHCVKSTLIDVFEAFGKDQIKKFILLTDCASNVPGFEKLGNDFVNEFVAKGMRTAKSTEVSI